jgi:hypothetical protein
MSERAASRPTLPVARTIVEGYWWAVWHLRTTVAMALVWATVVVFLERFLGSLPAGTTGLPRDGSPIRIAARIAPDLAIFATTLLGAAVIAVAAYRMLILDEPTDWRRALRPGRRELRVFGFSVLVYVGAVVEVLLLTLVLHLVGVTEGPRMPDPAYRLPVLIIAALLWSLLVAVTLTPLVGFVFPLAAIDAPSGLFNRSFRMGRGYRLRLACIAFLADAPWVLASNIPQILWEPTFSPMPNSLQTGLSTFITLLSTAFGAMVFGKAFTSIADRQYEGVYGVFD